MSRGLFNALSELGSVRMTPPRDSQAAAHRLAGALGAIARAHDIDVRVAGNVPRGAALIVANHVSYLDPIAILPNCPALPIAKGEVAGWPIVGAIGSTLGTMFVRREDAMSRARVLRRIHDLLSAGTSVLNFAEGTTTDGSAVKPFWRGTFGIAQRLGVPVVPVAIRYREPQMAWFNGATFFPHYLWATSRQRIDIALTFGPPILVRTGEPAEALAARARNTIIRLLENTRFDDAGTSSRLPSSRPDPVLPTTRVA